MQQWEDAVFDSPVKELRHAALAQVSDGGTRLALAQKLVMGDGVVGPENLGADGICCQEPRCLMTRMIMYE